jgi:ATP-binding cassette subfamily B protein
MGRLWHYLGRYRRLYLIGGVCLLGTVTLVMWIPWWTREIVRIIEQGGSMRDVTFYAVLIIVRRLVTGRRTNLFTGADFNAGRNVEYDLRNDLFAHLEKLPLSFYQSRRTGDLMSRVINDISAVRVMLGPGVLNFVNAPLYYVYAVALMLSMDVRMTVAALVPFPLLMYVARKFRGRIMNTRCKVQQQMSVLSSHVQENLSGMHVVKAYSRKSFRPSSSSVLNKDYEIKSMEMAKMRGIVNPVNAGQLTDSPC